MSFPDGVPGSGKQLLHFFSLFALQEFGIHDQLERASARRLVIELDGFRYRACRAIQIVRGARSFGAVQHFAVDTFTTGIFRAWFGLGEPIAAAQLAAVLLLFIAALVALERWSRRHARYHHTSTKWRPLPRYRLEVGQELLYKGESDFTFEGGKFHDRASWQIWGLPNCGKGDPLQTMRVAHGAPAARFRNVEMA